MLRALWRPSKFFGPNINRLYLVRALAGSCALLTRVCSLRTQTYFRTRRLLGLQWWSWLMFCRCRCRDYDLPWFLMERWCLTKRSQVRLKLVWVPRVEFSREGQRGKTVKTVKKKIKKKIKSARPSGDIDHTGKRFREFQFGIAYYWISLFGMRQIDCYGIWSSTSCLSSLSCASLKRQPGNQWRHCWPLWQIVFWMLFAFRAG